MSVSSWSAKYISVSLTIAEGVFGNKGNSIKISSLPIECTIHKAGLPDKGAASIYITGMKRSDMEVATILPFRANEMLKSHVTIEAGTTGGVSTVFNGDIVSAYADFKNAPDVVFQVDALEGGFAATIPSDPVSIEEGTLAVVDVVSQLAQEAGLTLQNQGVEGTSPRIVLSGDPIKKLNDYGRAVGFIPVIDGETLTIFPRGGYREGSTPLLSRYSGLVSYPRFSSTGITARCIFNPEIKFGSFVQVDSVVPRASGLWQVTRVTHNLGVNTSYKSPWLTEFDAVPYGDNTIFSTSDRGSGF